MSVLSVTLQVGYLRFYLAPKIDDDDVAEEGGAGNDEE